jgi:preprotein translocase subunit SecF
LWYLTAANSTIYRRLTLRCFNHSIIQTLQRSINTQLMTVEFMLFALVLFGGVMPNSSPGDVSVCSWYLFLDFHRRPVLVIWKVSGARFLG